VTLLPPPPATAHRLELRVELVGSAPPIWRRLSLPGETTLDRVHDILQAAFGWTNSHLHSFSLTEHRYAPSPIVTQDDLDEGDTGTLESAVRLDQLVVDPGDTFWYTYDFGDDWEHRAIVESVSELEAGDDAPRCVAGERVGPPEDSGGIHSYEWLLEVHRTPGHPGADDLAEQLAWLGLDADPAPFDLAAADRNVREADRARPMLTTLRAGTSPLAVMLNRCRDEPALAIVQMVMDATATAPAEPTITAAERGTAVIRGFLAHVPHDGIALTSAGYLPPRSVAAMMAELDPARTWFGEANREANTPPLFTLRETVTLLGLTRKYRGRLMLTRQGLQLRDDPTALWRYVASRLPAERTDYGRDLGVVLLLLVSAGEASNAQKLVDALESAAELVGWRFPQESAYSSAAYSSVVQTRHVLEWAASGQLITRRDSRLAGPEATSLARAAVGHQIAR
jgi:Plasmid pRiA4b ORF-3-like protein